MISDLEKKKKEYEMELVHERRKKLYEHPELRNLFIEVTSRCNAKCEHCGSRCDQFEQGDEIEAEYLKKTLKEISECYDPRTVYLNITGGEPLVRKDLFDILDYAVSLGFSWGMTSNGILINEKMMEKLEKAKLRTVSISIDGLEKTHDDFRKTPGGFKRILKGIDLLNNSKVVEITQVTTVVSKKNIHELEELYQLLLNHNVKYWRVVNCDPIGRANDNKDLFLDMDEYRYLFQFIQEKNKEGKMIDITYGCSHYLGLNLEKEIRKHYFLCMAGLYVGSILSNGDIFVCPNVPRRKELIQGNIRKDSFVYVWEKKYKEFRHEDRTSNKKCKACKHWNYCAGDAFHTWDFDQNKPSICLKPIFDE